MALAWYERSTAPTIAAAADTQGHMFDLLQPADLWRVKRVADHGSGALCRYGCPAAQPVWWGLLIRATPVVMVRPAWRTPKRLACPIWMR